MIRFKGDKPIDYSHLSQKEAEKLLRDIDKVSVADCDGIGKVAKPTLGYGTAYRGQGNVYTRAK